MLSENVGHMQDILDSVKKDQGSCTLEHLRELPTEEIKQKLLEFKGVGPKTASCVLMFSMGRHDFPVVSPAQLSILC